MYHILSMATATLLRTDLWPTSYTPATMKSTATTVKEYLASLPEEGGRRAGIEAVRQVILKNLDKHYEEGMMWGMIGYAVPHRVCRRRFVPAGCDHATDQHRQLSGTIIVSDTP